MPKEGRSNKKLIVQSCTGAGGSGVQRSKRIQDGYKILGQDKTRITRQLAILGRKQVKPETRAGGTIVDKTCPKPVWVCVYSLTSPPSSTTYQPTCVCYIYIIAFSVSFNFVDDPSSDTHISSIQTCLCECTDLLWHLRGSPPLYIIHDVLPDLYITKKRGSDAYLLPPH